MKELIDVQIETKDGINVVSSRVIAKELGKRHKHVTDQIEKILNEQNQNFGFGIIKSEYNDRGRMCKEYLLTKDGFTLYMFNIQGYNDFKMAYINKFNEMEKALQNLTPQLTQEQELQLKILNGANGLERTVALAEYKEFIEKPLLEEIQDKQEFIDDVVGCNGECIMVGDFAKLTKPRYGLGQNKLFQVLRDIGILRYQSGCNVPYQRFIDAKYFEVRETKY